MAATLALPFLTRKPEFSAVQPPVSLVTDTIGGELIEEVGVISVGTAVFMVIVAVVVGAAAGAFAFKAFHGGEKRNRELEQRLAEAERRFDNYQQDVTEHFAETARRVNNLTKQYKDVHEYLASSATKLTNPALSHEFLEAARRNLPPARHDSQKEAFDESGVTESSPNDNPAGARSKECVTEEP